MPALDCIVVDSYPGCQEYYHHLYHSHNHLQHHLHSNPRHKYLLPKAK